MQQLVRTYQTPVSRHTATLLPSAYNIKNKKAPAFADALLVELIDNSLQPLTLELERWHTIIGERHLDHKPEKQRNNLAYKPEGYATIYTNTKRSRR